MTAREMSRRREREIGVRSHEDYLAQKRLQTNPLVDNIGRLCTERLDLSNAKIAAHVGCSTIYVAKVCKARGIRRKELRKLAGSLRIKASAAG